MLPKTTQPDRPSPRHGIARVLSKLGLASRTQAAQWVRDGRVSVNGRIVRDPEFPVRRDEDRILVDDRAPEATTRRVIMLNKPRGLVTSARDERGRDTVYSCFDGADLPWMAPVGRLDKASEGLLLFTNDPEWAEHVNGPASALEKTYHVQIDRHCDSQLLAAVERGMDVDSEYLSAKSVRNLRRGDKHSWLEIVLEEGRNRQIRRLLTAFDVAVLRLVRIAMGALTLDTLGKGRWREITETEVEHLTRAARGKGASR